jgi:choline-sulfatase
MNRRTFLRTLACASAAGLCARAEEARKPNILLLYTDDQTFDSIRALGNSEIETPNLDRLAESGSVFRNCYNQGGWHGAICVASRTMLNTGRFLWEACALEKHLKEEARQRRFWSQLMHDAGYRHQHDGKWHVTGVQPAALFDEAATCAAACRPRATAAYERPKEGEPDLWQPWDESRGGH